MTSRPESTAPDVLAIIVPAYRARHLGRTLESLAQQTDVRFRVYVADDGSPEDIAGIVAPFRERLALVYHRFPDNCGGSSLVGHWHRSIALSREPWVWLFADDDEMEPGCVAAFHAARAEARGRAVDLFRFNLDLIDDAGRVYRRPTPHPDYEDAMAAATAIVGEHQREWRVSNHVFARDIYEARGGFPEFPLAFFSDYAAWIEFATPRGVRTIAGPRVRWRQHTRGVSSGFGRHRRAALLEGLPVYAGWLERYGRRLDPAERARFAPPARAHVFHFVGLLEPALNHAERRRLLAGLQRAWDRPAWRDWIDLARAVAKSCLRRKPGFGALARWRLRQWSPVA